MVNLTTELPLIREIVCTVLYIYLLNVSVGMIQQSLPDPSVDWFIGDVCLFVFVTVCWVGFLTVLLSELDVVPSISAWDSISQFAVPIRFLFLPSYCIGFL